MALIYSRGSGAGVRGHEYSIARVAQAWEAALGGPIGRDYQAWLAYPRRLRRARLLARYLPRAAMQRLLPNTFLR
ncbi:MAG: hypothetical protein VCB42_11930 [Myxococcota bacterium]